MNEMITLEEINAQIGKSVIINVNRTYNDISLYEATRKCWRMKINKAQQAEYVISEYRGKIVGVFKPKRWSICNEYPDRISFEGEDVTENYRQYLGLEIPRRRGNQNPIRYSCNYDNLENDRQRKIQENLAPLKNNQEDLNNAITASSSSEHSSGNEEISKSDEQNLQNNQIRNNDRKVGELTTLFKNFESQIRCFIIKIREKRKLHPYDMLKNIMKEDEIKDLRQKCIRNKPHNDNNTITNLNNISFKELVNYSKAFTIGSSFKFILGNWKYFSEYFNNNKEEFVKQSKNITDVRNSIMHPNDFPNNEDIENSKENVHKYLEIFSEYGCS